MESSELVNLSAANIIRLSCTRVLDIACGTGALAQVAAEAGAKALASDRIFGAMEVYACRCRQAAAPTR